MAGNISCPHCKRMLDLPEEQLGREVCCPECRRTFVVGASVDVMANLPPLPANVQAGYPEGEQPSRAGGDIDEDDLDIRRRVAPQVEYKPAAGLANVVKVLLGFNIVAILATLGSDYLQYQLAERLIAGAMVPPAEADGNDARQTAIGVGHFMVYLVTAIVFLIWFHRAHANLAPLGALKLTYTSGWAVGSWFVPFLNLIRPAQIAQEIWCNSAMHFDAEPGEREPPASSGLIWFWWTMWIGSNVISQISVRMALAVKSPDSLKSATAVGMVAECASLLAALLALAVVHAIDSRQSTRARALGLVA